MSKVNSRATGPARRRRRLSVPALPWLLLAIAALGVLSWAAKSDASPTRQVADSVPVPSQAPTGGVASPVGEPAGGTAIALGGPVVNPDVSPAPVSPAPSPTVGTVAAFCPPAILPGGTLVYRYHVIAAYPHDPGAFTQGLVYTNSNLYESTGLYVSSSLRRVDLETGQVLQKYVVPTTYFAEGIAVYGERIVQLTWRENTGFVYDRDTFELLDTFSYPTEGWGLTNDGTRLVMSDGTATLHFWDPQTRVEIGQVQVHDERGPVACLNELEYIRGQVYANVWQTDYIAVIDPATGLITAWIDLAGLLESQGPAPTADVLNGIAYDVEGDRLFVTGKYWPWLFEIELAGGPERTYLPLVRG